MSQTAVIKPNSLTAGKLAHNGKVHLMVVYIDKPQGTEAESSQTGVHVYEAS